MIEITFDKRKHKRREMSNYIIDTCHEKHIMHKDVATEMEISPQAFSKKLRRGQFTYDDLLIIFEVLGTTADEVLELMKV